MSAVATLAFLGLHPDRLRDLRARWGGDRPLLAAIRAGSVTGIAPGALVPPGSQRAALTASEATLVLRGDGCYPPALDGIGDPPPALFVKGAIPPGPGVAVVGTRRCTGYGRSLARAFGVAIARAGWVVVSGLARGIDGEAHRGALAAGGPVIGVLGCGPDRVYPAEHRDLHDAVQAAGALVTEYPPGAAPLGWRFPPRNRIIAGLSRAVVVVEAGRTGGALVTAAVAAEQGREVFAVPGDVDRESSAGCNLLIRDGAIPVLGADDLVEALSLLLGPPALVPDPGDGIPPSGIEIDDLGLVLGLDGAALHAWIGRQELDGRLRLSGTRVHPTG